MPVFNWVHVRLRWRCLSLVPAGVNVLHSMKELLIFENIQTYEAIFLISKGGEILFAGESAGCGQEEGAWQIFFSLSCFLFLC